MKINEGIVSITIENSDLMPTYLRLYKKVSEHAGKPYERCFCAYRRKSG